GWPVLLAGCIHNFFDGWMVGLGNGDSSGTVSRALSWGFAAHKIPEALAIGLLASTLTSSPKRALAVVLLVQTVFASGSLAVLFAGRLDHRVMDAFIAVAGAT